LKLAEQAYASLLLGADFSELADRISDDPGSSELSGLLGFGGELGFAVSENAPEIGPEYRQLANQIEKAGDIAGPVATTYRRGGANYQAVVIFKADEVIPQTYRPMSQVINELRK